jgi:hypothetical protein
MMGFWGDPQYHPDANNGWRPFSNDAIYRRENQDSDEDIEEVQVPREGTDWSGGDLEGYDTSNGYGLPRSSYTRSLR